MPTIPLIGATGCALIVFSQHLTIHFWLLGRLLFFVVGGVELFRMALQTQTIERSVLSSLSITSRIQ